MDVVVQAVLLFQFLDEPKGARRVWAGHLGTLGSLGTWDGFPGMKQSLFKDLPHSASAALCQILQYSRETFFQPHIEALSLNLEILGRLRVAESDHVPVRSFDKE